MTVCETYHRNGAALQFERLDEVVDQTVVHHSATCNYSFWAQSDRSSVTTCVMMTAVELKLYGQLFSTSLISERGEIFERFSRLQEKT